ncbi:NAD-dependent epimerase/dehydratase family protein [Aurantimonas sp. MSK8Z-1]|uniref:NAD-dependent epimerase/dehydratase family protein n=1 Tax=Mangrovibrevibacter kandeliae TaxID=2968473 RepID=UPI002117D714|nr:NAD-dependent epimerase/dehydratase family protein [Aurantimonas sp. MSK8Z-1]MCW4114807.1 NAD-dependent epimerase/dehydratase family protein [Aurantimonas sp. MSK8Z-1]
METADDRVLLTGVSGFLARHIAVRLLEAGWHVRGSVRSPGMAETVRATLRDRGLPVDRLEFCHADLGEDAGWDAAAANCGYVIHTATAFPLRQPRDRFALVPIARGGTLRVVEAAKRAGVARMVLTSSVAAIGYGHGSARAELTEADWSNVDSPSISPYAVSKTLAEKAAWEAVAGSDLQLTAINPAVIFGPLLDPRIGTSARIIRMMLFGHVPAVPNIAFGIVDARDVAAAHVAALTAPDVAGRRFILNAGTRSMAEIAHGLRRAFPNRSSRLPRWTLPDWTVRAAALVVPSARHLLPELGRGATTRASRHVEILNLELRSPEEAAEATAADLLRLGLV